MLKFRINQKLHCYETLEIFRNKLKKNIFLRRKKNYSWCLLFWYVCWGKQTIYFYMQTLTFKLDDGNDYCLICLLFFHLC